MTLDEPCCRVRERTVAANLDDTLVLYAHILAAETH